MSLIVLLAAGMVSLLFFRVEARRVDRLKEFSRRVARGDFRPLSVDRKGDELSDLARTLNEVAGHLRANERDFAALERAACAVLAEDGFKTHYVSIRRPHLHPPAPGDGQLLILAAATLGTTRLIDNLLVSVD